MMPFLPLLLVLAGLTIFFSKRKCKAIEKRESHTPPVVVKGHTYFDSVEDVQIQPVVRTERVKYARCVCVIGAGYMGALTAIVLASQNPHIPFHVVDSDEQLIAAWNSDRVPVPEPGLEEMLFEDATESSPTQNGAVDQDSEFGAFVSQLPRARKLKNINFSTNVHAGVTVADLIFLCAEARSSTKSEELHGLDLSHIQSALQAIAQVSTGHKIIVQKAAAPCASPSASFDVLSNPDFVVPGSALRDLLYPPRIVIGHVYSEDMSPEALTAVRRLYTPFVSEERIITMDAWSAELSKLVASALLAQQITSLNSLSLLCESTNAKINHITQILGLSQRAGLGFSASQRVDLLCLVYLARELGMSDIVDYWASVLRMNELQPAWMIQRVVGRISGALVEKKVALLGMTSKHMGDMSGVIGLVRELTQRGVEIRIFEPYFNWTDQGLCISDARKGFIVANSAEMACMDCHAVMVITDREEFGPDQVRWQGIARHMKTPKLLVDLSGRFDQLQMQQWGFDLLDV
ncbi:putative UDP-glucose dehydrogenase Ugd1 [Aspergillus tanneri]|uniref:UDP-glucose 6-dehydrogenase n=1 Tax=Aspergillus tanneri TaxID=1220188 RepID=A0A5M9MA89_9EURO|nr:uncharacterized protein ATNIH1004_010583 [Aspergillus tanneri]KAA8643808.1 hypothetical protein ATNIH1004_010583 [Aspergillus tanneri]